MVALSDYSSSLINSLPPYLHDDATRYMDHKPVSNEDDFLGRLEVNAFPTSSNRHRPASSQEERVCKTFFAAALRKNPIGVIAAAEAAAGRSFYPLWKRVTYIHIPKAIGYALSTRVVKVALVVSSAYFIVSSRYLQIGFNATLDMAARTLIYLVNNSPTKVVRVFILAKDSLLWAQANSIAILASTLIAWAMVRVLPETPYLTATFKSLDRLMWRLYIPLVIPQVDVAIFLFQMTFPPAKFIWNGSDDTGRYFQRLAENGESDMLAVSKKCAYELFKEQRSLSPST